MWTPYDRGLEHLVALQNSNLESPLVEHQQEYHLDEPPQFEFKVDGYQLRPLDRQVQEASNIEEFDGDLILNRDGEWGQNLPPKLCLEVDP